MHTDHIEFLVLFFLGASILIAFISFSKKTSYRHGRNRETAVTVIETIKSFEFEGQKINYLKKIDPFVFEELLLNAFKERGYKILRNKRYTGDGGIDGIIYDSQNNKILVQAKRYKSYISRRHVEDFRKSVINKKAKKGLFIHTGKTGKATRSAYFQTHVRLVGGARSLSLILGQYYISFLSYIMFLKKIKRNVKNTRTSRIALLLGR